MFRTEMIYEMFDFLLIMGSKRSG